MAKRIVVDLDRWRLSPDQEVRCVYFYHPENEGVALLREIAAFEHFCRKCELAPCVEACPRSALEKNDEGVLVRHNLRCVGCMSCSGACPFGTILEEALRFHVGGCDCCESLIASEGKGTVPGCVESCTTGALEYREVGADEEAFTLVGERLAVRGRSWEKTDEPAKAGAGAKK